MPCHRQSPAAIAVAVLGVLTWSASATAQTANINEAPPRTQLGVSAGVVFFLPTVGARLSVPLSANLALEGGSDFMPMTFDEGYADWLLFQGQLRHRLKRGRSWRMHATYGMTLFARHTQARERRQSRPDGSVLVYPGYRRLRVERPGVHAGLGGQRAVSDSVVAQWDVQLMVSLREGVPVPRAAFGIAWQAGGTR